MAESSLPDKQWDDMPPHAGIIPKFIATTPAIQPPCCTPGRIVIREFDDEYVVHHAECDLNGNPTAYYWGHYFKKGEPDALKNAMKIFVRKAVEWHGLESVYPYTNCEPGDQS